MRRHVVGLPLGGDVGERVREVGLGDDLAEGGAELRVLCIGLVEDFALLLWIALLRREELFNAGEDRFDLLLEVSLRCGWRRGGGLDAMRVEPGHGGGAGGAALDERLDDADSAWALDRAE